MSTPDPAHQAATAAASARAQLAADPQRPHYHFVSSDSWLNDPNGLIHWRGRYHMFYQYNPHGAFHGTIHWGHAVSDDLVRWQDLPVALAPTPGGPDAEGCWSGCAVDHDGTPTLVYTGISDGEQHTCLATSDDDLVTWSKYAGNPIIRPPAGLDLLAFRDHSIWREGEYWYQVIGSGLAGVGGVVLLYRSHDMLHWEYLHPLCTGDSTRTQPLWTGTIWECPDFFALGDLYALTISVHDGVDPAYSMYFTGRYENHRFIAEREVRFELGDCFYAPQSVTDAHGRRLMWGWLREARTDAAQRAAGWSGIMSLPRVLAARPDGLLDIRPAPELQQLRRAHIALGAHPIVDATVPLPQSGDRLEIIVEWAPGDAGEFGLELRRSPDGDETTRLVYDSAGQRLLIDRTRSSLSDEVLRDVRGGAFPLAPDEPLQLHIFVDASCIEVFANNRATLCERIYPTRADSLGLAAFATGGTATLASFNCWTLDSIWPAHTTH